MSILSIDDMIGSLMFMGARLSRDVREVVTDSKFSASTSAVTQVSLSVTDPKFELLASGIFKTGVPVSFGAYKMQVTAVETVAGSDGAGAITVACRSAVVAKLKKRTGTKVYADVSPTTFVHEECKAVGAKFVGQKSASRKQVARDVKKKGEDDTGEKPSSWTTFQRLAGELGFVCFEVAGTVFFGKPTWLIKRTGVGIVKVAWGGSEEFAPLSVPNCRRSLDSDEGTTISFELPKERAASVQPGMKLVLSGIPTFNGDYLITSVDHPLAGTATVSVQAATPIDPDIQEAETTSSSPFATGQQGDKSVFQFVYLCQKQQGDRYVLGAEANANDPDPDTFDCSELTEWAAGQAGGYLPDGALNQYKYCVSKGLEISLAEGIRTRGALLFKTKNPVSGTSGHVAVSLGNGKTIEAMGSAYGVREGEASSRRFDAAGLVPGLRYSTTAEFDPNYQNMGL